MHKVERPQEQNTPDPILEINEFEEETGSILDLARKEAAKIIQEAKVRAEVVISKVKEASASLEKEFSEKVEKELVGEKERLIQSTKEQLEDVRNIPEEKIKQAVDCILKRIMPR